MNEHVVLLCPGQGAQALGMGRAWCEQSEAARRVFERAEHVLDADPDLQLPASLRDLCYQGPADMLHRTDVAQPALFVAAVACAAALAERDPRFSQPRAAAGLSLGEYTALHLAGAMSFDDGLRLVALRGRAMQDAAQASPSGMVALIGADEASAAALCDAAAQGEVLVPANLNAPGQVVISGSAGACARAAAMAGDHKLRAAPLPVAGAFHSPLMQPAADRLAHALRRAAISAPRCPVLSNVTAQPHDPDPDAIRGRLAEQLTSAVRWSGCCEWLLRQSAGAEFHELAPGKTLAGLMRRISRETAVVAHDEPAE